MGLALDLLGAMVGEGDLYLHPDTERRMEELRPEFEQAEAESMAHPLGPIPANLLRALAWTESSFRPGVDGPPLAGGHRAEGLMQIHTAHYGRRFYTWGAAAGLKPFTWSREIRYHPLLNLRAAVHLLFTDFQYGRRSIWWTLARYGGHVRADPRPYVGRVTRRHTFLTARALLRRTE